jgi:hypothetical protein
MKRYVTLLAFLLVAALSFLGCSLAYRWRNDLGVIVFDSRNPSYRAQVPHAERFEKDRSECGSEASAATLACDTEPYTPIVARICQQRSHLYGRCMEDKGYVREGCRDCRW